ncbi:MAG TPA: hypothetical protein VGS97_08215 [Actinocrinis sp.]|uniref:hypothetical protein n=1 Tax=Actinocrinis sp. TaxID=1920516 RepID=UPI002DDD5EEC|nr:hypothetical protein [Actinocrinis sp.]HEV2344061.1 hypothetical protein [Actinocrinis sp.]
MKPNDPPLTEEFIRRRRKRAVELVLACIAGLIPWTIFLAVALPDQYRAHHWRLTWAGFDGLLLLGMSLTIYFGWRRRQAVIPASIVTATLLICDAWFDITLDLGTSDVWWSVASAVLVELPLAAFFIHRALLLINLTIRQAYRRLGVDEPPPPFLKVPLFGLTREPEGD